MHFLNFKISLLNLNFSVWEIIDVCLIIALILMFVFFIITYVIKGLKNKSSSQDYQKITGLTDDLIFQEKIKVIKNNLVLISNYFHEIDQFKKN